MLSSQKIHCGIIKILKFFFLTQNFSLSLSLCCRAAGDVKHTKKKLFSLSVFLFKICCVIYPRGRSSVHSSKRVTTGPNGLERVPSQRVPTGLTGGGEERSMTRLLSPHNNIIYIIYLKKFYFYSYFFSLSAIIHENIYIYKKKIYSYSYLFIYLFIT